MNTTSSSEPKLAVNFHIDIEPRKVDINKLKLKILVKDYITPDNDTKEMVRVELSKSILEALEKPSARISPTGHHIDPVTVDDLVNKTVIALDEFKNNQFFRAGCFLIEMSLHRKIGETGMTTSTFIIGPSAMMIYVCSSFYSFIDLIIEKKKCLPQQDLFDLSI